MTILPTEVFVLGQRHSYVEITSYSLIYDLAFI